ncbi:MAG: dicarboxylate/amino acid:cation symporter [Phycisphaerales bacterium]
MKLPLHVRIAIALFLGVVVGLVLNFFWTPATWAAVGVNDSAAYLKWAPAEANVGAGAVAAAIRFLVEAVQFVGRFFVQVLRFAAVPIVLFSLVAGAASLGNPRTLGRMGLRAVAIFMATTVFAVVLGLLVANLFAPGKGIDPAVVERLLADGAKGAKERISAVGSVEGVWSMLLNVVPRNPFDALARGEMLQVIVFALVIGVGLTALPRERAAPVAAGFATLGEVFTLVVNALMRLAPFACFCLIAPVVTLMGVDVIRALAFYALLAAGAMGVLLYVEYPLLLMVLARADVRAFYRAMIPAQLTALSTSSSNATLPVTMAGCRAFGISEQTTSFVCPLGATINMDGTAMYQAMAAVFIAQLSGIDLSLGQQITLLLTAVLAAVGAPGIPSSGMVMLVGVLSSIGVPPEGIAVILGIDPLLDRLRTVVNVTGDAMTAAIIDRAERARSTG